MLDAQNFPTSSTLRFVRRLTLASLVVSTALVIAAPASGKVLFPSAVNRAAVADFNGDGLTDVAVFRPSSGMFYDRSTGQAIALGQVGDIPVPGDFNSDGRSDFAVFRPGNGTWYDQSTGQTIPYGASNGGDEPVPGDYNGDGRTDIAVYRPSTATWYDRDTGTAIVYGAPNLDIPVPGDYNGDGRTDIAVYRPTTGMWYDRDTGTAVQFGQPGDIPIAGDYNGDGRTDIAVYRAATATWLDRDASTTIVYGAPNHDIPVPGDYNGNGRTDVAVYRPSTATWYNRDAATATVYGAPNADMPVPAAPAWYLVSSDKSAPSAPTGLTVTGTTATSITVSWTGSNDNVGVTGYGHYLNGTLVDSAAGTTYTFTGLSCNTSYTTAVDATDAAGNRSGKASANATTDACPTGGVDWLQFDGSGSHFGVNAGETTITPANVNTLTQKWQVTLPAYADGAPAVATGVQTASGPQDLVIVTTRGGGLLARNLQTGAAVWSITFGPGSCTINNQGATCYTTSSPVIDRATNAAYTYGLDGKVHKVDLGTGAEVTTAPWPVVATLKPWDEKGSSALSSATAANGHTYLYAVHSGYPGDGGDYQGHLTAIDLADGSSHVFNTLCSDQTVHFTSTTPDCAQRTSGVWARSGATYSAATNKTYIVTGNATFDGSRNWGDTVLALNPDGTGVNGGPVDSYTPTNYQQLDSSDLDLGSTLPALVDLPTPNGTLHLGVQGGKDANLRLINVANLSGQGAPGHTGGELQSVAAPGGNGVITAPAVWTDGSGTRWVFVGTGGAVAGYQLALNGSNQPQLTRIWQVSISGTSPVVANGVLYVAGGSTIRALNPTTGAQLWSAPTGAIHWQSPVVADGLVLFEDNAAHLTAWGP
jgi:putative pyrroloquinoline-quinone binding quinoprotein/VCBS repeat protein/fibronectin type III domain protein/FG-GAP repeat protein